MKRVHVVWTEESLNDLEVIYDFLASKSPRAAKKIIESILSRSSQLGEFPESGSIQAVKSSTGRVYRYLVEGNYKIIYSYSENGLFVETIIDTRQNPTKLKL